MWYQDTDAEEGLLPGERGGGGGEKEPLFRGSFLTYARPNKGALSATVCTGLHGGPLEFWGLDHVHV